MYLCNDMVVISQRMLSSRETKDFTTCLQIRFSNEVALERHFFERDIQIPKREDKGLKHKPKVYERVQGRIFFSAALLFQHKEVNGGKKLRTGAALCKREFGKFEKEEKTHLKQ